MLAFSLGDPCGHASRHDAIVDPPSSPRNTVPNSPLRKSDYEALSEFRYQLRRFLRFSEQAAQSEGITPQQYQLLLHIKGYPQRDQASIGELAERLQVQQHGVVALVTRCEQAGLVRRSAGTHDRRQVLVGLTPAGERCLRRLARLHRNELDSLSKVFAVARMSAFNDRE
jgi:DNA-binding MarR family transcriptional regulator